MNEREFKTGCWMISTVVAKEVWHPSEPLYPGHDPGSHATRSFSVVRLGKRLLLMSKATEASAGGPLDDYTFEAFPLSNEPDLDQSIDLLRYDGWAFSKLCELSAVPDESSKFCQLLSSFYQPSEWSLITARLLLEVLTGKLASGFEYFITEGDKFRVDPVASGGVRTGVTTGIDFLVSDEELCRVLDVLRVPYARGDAVHRCLPPAVVDKLVTRGKEVALADYRCRAKVALASEIEVTKNKLAELQQRMDHLTKGSP
jgi:hypothetical protein